MPPTRARPAVTTRFVTLARFAELSGYSEKAVSRKIEDGVWLEGHEYVRAPDGRLLIDMEGFERWAEGRRAAA